MSIHQSKTVSLADQLPGVLACPIVMCSLRDDLLTGKFPCQLLNLFLLRGELYCPKNLAQKVLTIPLDLRVYRNKPRQSYQQFQLWGLGGMKR